MLWQLFKLLRKLWPSSKPAVFRSEWSEVLGRLPFSKELDEPSLQSLKQDVAAFVQRVDWEGRAGLEVDDEMRVSIAAQACRLSLGLHKEAFRFVRSIYVFPTTYSTEGATDASGVQKRSHRHGEAWLRGPVILSWNATQLGGKNPDDGRNVVYHEFAHKLDMLDRFADGTPPIEDRETFDAWTRIMGSEYQDLKQAAERGKKTLLDKYGATNPAEFFAVATEAFFERPERLRDRHKELYGCLCRFYNQNPARGQVGL